MAQSEIKVVFFDLGETLVTSNNKWVPGAQAVLTKLKGWGLRLGVISNTGLLKKADLGPHLPPTFSWEPFDPALIILSGEVGVEKPDRAIFKLAVTAAACPAAEVLFCTETLMHTLAAERTGMRTARVLAPPQSDLSKLPDALVAAGVVAGAP